MTPEDQIQAQERTILQQNVVIAKQQARITDLVQALKSGDRFIGRLQDQIKRLKHSEAEKVFGHGQGS